MKLFNCSVVVLLLMATSCNVFDKRVKGNGNLTTQNRSVSDFDEIKVEDNIDVEVTKGPTSVKVQADENLMEFIDIKQGGGDLKIRSKDGINLVSENRIKVFVSTPALKGLSIAGSGNIDASLAKFETNDEFDLRTAGSGNIKAALRAPSVSARIAGNGNIHVSGECRDVKVKIAGSGDFSAMELKSENAEISISGSGNVSIFADVNLRVKIAGSGDIKYRGNASVDKSIAGSGSITKIN